MSEMKTLREICERTGASRRAVQGYEKAGLVKPIGRNKYGHLLYGDEEEEKVKSIRFFQKIGFPIREIESLLYCDDEEKIRRLREKISAMEEDIEEKRMLIEKTKELIREMEA